MTNTLAANQVIREPINEHYERIQYNKKLRLIHSIDDDMYQMQSIIDACQSTKQPDKWFNNKSTKALLAKFGTVEFYGAIKPWDLRSDI